MSHDDASLLWHWRCGFELQSNPASWRILKATDSIASAVP